MPCNIYSLAILYCCREKRKTARPSCIKYLGYGMELFFVKLIEPAPPSRPVPLFSVLHHFPYPLKSVKDHIVMPGDLCVYSG